MVISIGRTLPKICVPLILTAVPVTPVLSTNRKMFFPSVFVQLTVVAGNVMLDGASVLLALLEKFTVVKLLFTVAASNRFGIVGFSLLIFVLRVVFDFEPAHDQPENAADDVEDRAHSDSPGIFQISCGYKPRWICTVCISSKRNAGVNKRQIIHACRAG